MDGSRRPILDRGKQVGGFCVRLAVKNEHFHGFAQSYLLIRVFFNFAHEGMQWRSGSIYLSSKRACWFA